MWSVSLILLSTALGTTAALTTDDPVGTVCGIDCNASNWGSINITVPSGGYDRWALVHVPSNYDPGTATGLIVSFHGNDKTAPYQENLSQFSNSSYNPDWFAVYPQGVNNSWEGPLYANYPPRDDLQFTKDLLAYMSALYNIDSTKIFATGKSNGGGFVGTLACNSAGAGFSAFAPVSGAFYTDVNSGSPCSPTRMPLPIMEFHGASDTIMRYNGGCNEHGGCHSSIPFWLHRWATRNGCSGSPPANHTYPEEGGAVSHSSWTCNGYKHIIQGYLVSGLGHKWPSTNCNCDNKGNVTVVDATDVIMKFFQDPLQTVTKGDHEQGKFEL